MSELKYYLTYPDRRSLEDARDDLGNHSGNVIAVYAGPIAGAQGLSMFAWVPTRNEANSAVTRGKISLIYLTDYCRAISERDARSIHPRLFSTLHAGTNNQN